MSSIAVLILAAGASNRMGRIKQLLPYKNTTLLGWAIEQALESEANEAYCVLGANADLIKQHVAGRIPCILNKQHKEGLSSSIIAGVKALVDRRAILIMLADQPNILAKDLNELLRLSDKYPNSIIACSYGDSVGVPAVFPIKHFPDLLELEGDKGAKNYLHQHKEEIHLVNSLRLTDIDTQEDYNRLIE